MAEPIETVIESLLNQFGSMNESLRLDFLKSCINMCPLDDMKKIKKFASRSATKKKKTLQEAAESPAEAAATPAEAAATPVQKGWWKKWKKKDIYAIDCEMVVKNNGEHELATVAIVDAHRNIILKKKVRHEPGSFILNPALRRITGFKEDSLIGNDCEPIDDVIKKVKDLIKDKLLIVCGGSEDFKALHIIPAEYDYFDIQWFFKQEQGYDRYGQIVLQPLGLRRLCLHFFNRDIQKGAHSALIDAQATLEMFYKYTELTTEPDDYKHYEIYDIPKIK